MQAMVRQQAAGRANALDRQGNQSTIDIICTLQTARFLGFCEGLATGAQL
jgi:hypothetical protein